MAILTAAGGKAAFNQIKVPTLGFFANPTAEFPAVAWLDPERQAEWRQIDAAGRPWSLDVIPRFRSEIHEVEVVEIPHAEHEIFITHEAQVVEKMRRFLLSPQAGELTFSNPSIDGAMPRFSDCELTGWVALTASASGRQSRFWGRGTAFSHHENGKVEPPLALIKRLKVLDRHPDWLNDVRSS